MAQIQRQNGSPELFQDLVLIHPTTGKAAALDCQDEELYRTHMMSKWHSGISMGYQWDINGIYGSFVNGPSNLPGVC